MSTAPGPVIGLRREREVLTVALQTNRHVVLEGPPGTGKSTLLRAIAVEVGQDVVFVEGNAESRCSPRARSSSRGWASCGPPRVSG